MGQKSFQTAGETLGRRPERGKHRRALLSPAAKPVARLAIALALITVIALLPGAGRPANL
jgi:hypothetical protein